MNRLIKSFLQLVFIGIFSFVSVFVYASFGNNNRYKIQHDQRPTVYEYSLMSKYAYENTLKQGQEVSKLPGWKIHEIYEGRLDYRAVIFKNVFSRQLVIAYRGTVPSKLGNLYEDFTSIYLNKKVSDHKVEVFSSIKKEIDGMFSYAEEENYTLSFTGHSLGAFLAELSVFFCHDSFDYLEASAVTFESPGSFESMEALQSNLQEKVSLDKLDIRCYVGTPNIINILNHHVGSLYQIEHDLGESVGGSWNPAAYTLSCHSMDNIVKYFEEYVSTNSDYKAYYMSDWPLGFSIFTKGEKDKYFDLAKWDNDCNCYRLPEDIEQSVDDLFTLKYKANYQIQEQFNPKHAIPLKHFGFGMQKFLYDYYITFIDILGNVEDKESLLNELNKVDIPNEIKNYLISFRLVESKGGNIVLVLPEDASYGVHEFRNKITEYLKKVENINKINDVLNSINSEKNRLDIDLAIVESGAWVGEVINGAVIGIDATLSPDLTDRDLIELHRKQQLDFIERLSEMNVKIKVRIAEKGANITKMENVVVKGVDVGVN